MDASFFVDNNRLKLRVSGIIIHDNRILLDVYDKEDYCLPGGTINFNESSDDSILRELEEEIGFKFVIDRLVSINEEFYVNFKNYKTHCINFYYKMSFKDSSDIDKIDLDRLEDDHGYMCQHHYRWVDIDDLNNIKLIPEVIKNDIITGEFNIHHVIRD